MECPKGQERWINLLIRFQSRGTVIVCYTDKKITNFPDIYKEIQNGAVAKSYMSD
jgi:hypothetical protein